MKRCPFFAVIGLMLGLLVSQPVPGQAEEISPTIVLESIVHFTAPDGSDLLVPAGTYAIAAEGEHLRLVQERGDAVFVIEAQRGSHDQSGDLQIAVTIPGEGEESDVVFVGLLMPDRTSLEATGSYSGVRGRGFGDRAQQFRQNIRQAMSHTAASIQARAPQVAVALCKGALRTRPAALARVASARVQSQPILQDPRFRKLAEEAMQTFLHDKADVIRRLVEEARFLASPQNRDRIRSLISGERLCERPFHEISGGIRQVYASMPSSRSVQAAPPEPTGTIAVSGEGEYGIGLQGAIGLLIGGTPDYGRLFWSIGPTLDADVDAKGAIKVGLWFEPPPTGTENRLDFSVKGGIEGGLGVAIELHFAWNRIRDEWQAKKLKSLLPYVSGFELGPSASVTPGPTVGLDIGYTRVTRFAW